MIQICKLNPNSFRDFGKADACMPMPHPQKPSELRAFSKYRRMAKYYKFILHYFREKRTGCGRN